VLEREIFYSLKEVQILIRQCRLETNTQRPHSAVGYRPPARLAAFRPAANLVSQPPSCDVDSHSAATPVPGPMSGPIVIRGVPLNTALCAPQRP